MSRERTAMLVNSRGRLRGGRIALLIALVMAGLVGCSPSRKGEVMLKDVVLSPDGGLAAVQYCEGKPLTCGIAILDLKTDALNLIPNPPGKQLIHPNFSLDGRRLAAAMACAADCQGYDKYQTQIVVIELATGRMTQVTEGPEYRADPVFQPNSDKLLVVSRKILEHTTEKFGHEIVGLGRYTLSLVDPKDRSETLILKESDGFVTLIGRPSFVGPDEVVFLGIVPVSAEQRRAVAGLGKYGGERTLAAYRLQFGGMPVLLPENNIPTVGEIPTISGLPVSEFSGLSASHDGQRLIFIDLSSIEPKQKSGAYNLEIFKEENGKIEQMTKLRTFMALSYISYDGRFVAFLADETRQKRFDLFILDLATREVRPTNLRARLESELKQGGHQL